MKKIEQEILKEMVGWTYENWKEYFSNVPFAIFSNKEKKFMRSYLRKKLKQIKLTICPHKVVIEEVK